MTPQMQKRIDSPTKRMLILLCGHCAVVLGIIGLLLPLVPTSPFMILAAACYIRTSEVFYRKLIENRYFGPSILQWETYRCVEWRVKGYALLMLAVTFTISGVLFANTTNARIGVAALACVLMLLVIFLPTCGKDKT